MKQKKKNPSIWHSVTYGHEDPSLPKFRWKFFNYDDYFQSGQSSSVNHRNGKNHEETAKVFVNESNTGHTSIKKKKIFIK